MNKDNISAESEMDFGEDFRDSISTVDADGKRVWLFPKKPSGRYYNARTWVSFFFVVIFLILPFIKVNGYQFLLFDIIHRQFVLFGVLFTPQDFYLFGLVMITMFVFIILFTVVFGRLFCGWVCPQTIFMEMIFRKIEYWIEGDAPAQRRLDKAPWNADKIKKKSDKTHYLFYDSGGGSQLFFGLYYWNGQGDSTYKGASRPTLKWFFDHVGLLFYFLWRFFAFARASMHYDLPLWSDARRLISR